MKSKPVIITQEKLNFTDYYKNLPELQTELRDRIIEKLEFKSKMTFYNKINNDSWTAVEREAVEKIVEEFKTDIKNSIS